jgi:alcohol dehydrogenase class IV
MGKNENTDIANEIEKLNSEIGLPKNLGEMGVVVDMIPYLVEHSLADVCNFTTPRNPSSKEYENLFLEAIG